MGGKTKKGKGRLDKFYHLAKEQGYRSRAAFKLIQLNRKYDFLSNCRALLDLCAAPGGWLQVAAKYMPMSSLILGVDLVPIKPVRGVKTLIGDITTQSTRQALKKEAKGSMFDVVVHDGAPNVGGAWANEAYTQAALVLDSLKLATEFLVPKGCFVTKVFRSKDYNALLYAFNQLFDKVEATKPTASRNTSAEIFVVCQGYKAPAKIDPRLLDPKHLFQEVVEAPKNMGPEALLRQKIKQVRHREGYEEGLSTSHKVKPALEFITSVTPVELLGQVTQLALEGPHSWQPVPELETADIKEIADKVRRDPATTAEVRALCTDLQVLGRTEFKLLLRWRQALRKSLAADLGLSDKKGNKEGSKEGEGEGAGAAPVDTEAALLAEMEAAREALEKREKKDKKKARELKRKARIRAATLGATQGIIDDNGPDEMFALSSLKSDSSTLRKLADTRVPGERELELLEAPDSSDEMVGGESSDSDEDEEARDLRYERQLEEALEDSYKQYLERKGHRDDVVKEKRRRLGKDLELDSDEEGGVPAPGSGSDDDDDHSDDSHVMSDGDDEESDDEEPAPRAKRAKRDQAADLPAGGGLLVELDERRAGIAKSGPAMAAQWFAQDLFDDPNLVADDDEEEEEEEEGSEQHEETDGYARASSHAQAGTSQPNGSAKSSDKQAAGKTKAKGQAAAAAAASAADSDSDELGGSRKAGGKNPGFEVVPLAKEKQRRKGKAGQDSESESSGTDSEDEFDMLDDQGKAEVLALAKRMLRRKEKESIIDAAYNRFAFHDTGLPRWFAEDERHHMRPILPVTKEEVEAEKARLRAIDARPIKKVAEAKGRQKRRAQAKLSQAREKAEAIAAQEDVPMSSKMREIEKVYARARAAGKKGKGKGKGGKGGKGKDGKRRGPPLDKRMLKDKRGQKAADKKKGGRKGGKGKKGR